jgi:hypothetical protein
MVPVHVAMLWARSTPLDDPEDGSERARILAQATSLPGRHLILIRYGPDHEILAPEWVYNEAEVDRAKVVWARDMGTTANQEVIQYFKGYRVWLINADDASPRLLPYSPGPESMLENKGQPAQ